jgi:hypothetical protein
MADTVVVSSSKNVAEQNRMGLTPACTLETIKRFHGAPGESAANPAPRSIEADAPVRSAINHLAFQLGQDGGIPRAAAEVLARRIIEIENRLTAIEAAR